MTNSIFSQLTPQTQKTLPGALPDLPVVAHRTGAVVREAEEADGREWAEFSARSGASVQEGGWSPSALIYSFIGHRSFNRAASGALLGVVLALAGTSPAFAQSRMKDTSHDKSSWSTRSDRSSSSDHSTTRTEHHDYGSGSSGSRKSGGTSNTTASNHSTSSDHTAISVSIGDDSDDDSPPRTPTYELRVGGRTVEIDEDAGFKGALMSQVKGAVDSLKAVESEVRREFPSAPMVSNTIDVSGVESAAGGTEYQKAGDRAQAAVKAAEALTAAFKTYRDEARSLTQLESRLASADADPAHVHVQIPAILATAHQAIDTARAHGSELSSSDRTRAIESAGTAIKNAGDAIETYREAPARLSQVDQSLAGIAGQPDSEKVGIPKLMHDAAWCASEARRLLAAEDPGYTARLIQAEEQARSASTELADYHAAPGKMAELQKSIDQLNAKLTTKNSHLVAAKRHLLDALRLHQAGNVGYKKALTEAQGEVQGAKLQLLWRHTTEALGVLGLIGLFAFVGFELRKWGMARATTHTEREQIRTAEQRLTAILEQALNAESDVKAAAALAGAPELLKSFDTTVAYGYGVNTFIREDVRNMVNMGDIDVITRDLLKAVAKSEDPKHPLKGRAKAVKQRLLWAKSDLFDANNAREAKASLLGINLDGSRDANGNKLLPVVTIDPNIAATQERLAQKMPGVIERLAKMDLSPKEGLTIPEHAETLKSALRDIYRQVDRSLKTSHWTRELAVLDDAEKRAPLDPSWPPAKA